MEAALAESRGLDHSWDWRGLECTLILALTALINGAGNLPTPLSHGGRLHPPHPTAAPAGGLFHPLCWWLPSQRTSVSSEGPQRCCTAQVHPHQQTPPANSPCARLVAGLEAAGRLCHPCGAPRVKLSCIQGHTLARNYTFIGTRCCRCLNWDWELYFRAHPNYSPRDKARCRAAPALH